MMRGSQTAYMPHAGTASFFASAAIGREKVNWTRRYSVYILRWNWFSPVVDSMHLLGERRERPIGERARAPTKEKSRNSDNPIHTDDLDASDMQRSFGNLRKAKGDTRERSLTPTEQWITQILNIKSLDHWRVCDERERFFRRHQIANTL